MTWEGAGMMSADVLINGDKENGAGMGWEGVGMMSADVLINGDKENGVGVRVREWRGREWE